MELFQLRSFLKVVEEGSITRAAEALFITQPAVTQHIRALERELEATLFDRTGRGMRLTSAGTALLESARRSLAALDECRQVITDLESGSSGRLSLGAGVTTSVFHLPRWLRAFRESHSGVDIVVRTGRSREVAEMIIRREIDLGFVTTDVQEPEIVSHDLLHEEIVLVAPPDDPLAGRDISPDELSVAPLILFPRDSGFRQYIDRELASAGIAVSAKMESDSAEAIKGFVAVGLGLSFLPVTAVEGEVASGALSISRIKSLPALRRRTSVIYRRDRYQSAAAKGFLDILRNK